MTETPPGLSGERHGVVVGGGIAGLAAALAFARAGWAITLYEASHHLSEVGAGIQLGPNAVKALNHLGLRSEISRDVATPDAIISRDGLTGTTLTQLPLGPSAAARFGAPYWTIHRGHLHAALLSAVQKTAAVKLVTGHRITRVTVESPQRFRFEGAASFDAATVGSHSTETNDSAAKSWSLTADLVISADGVRSACRAQVAPDVSLAHLGKTAARALISFSTIEAAGICTPEFAARLRNNVGLWMLPSCHVVHYPVSGGRELNLVVLRADDWEGDPDVWSAPVDAQSVVASLGTDVAADLRSVIETVPEWSRWRLAELPSLPHWHRDGVVLIGDAAHPVLPFLAQGAAFALEDAVVLADVLQRTTNTEEALAIFETLRKPRASRLQAASRRNGQIYHLSGVARFARNTVMRVTPPAALLRPYEWLYDWSAPANVK